MKRLYFVEPVVAVYAFACFMVYPLVQQYVYRRLWQEITNTSYPAMDPSSRCTTNSSNHSIHHEASYFSPTRVQPFSPTFVVGVVCKSKYSLEPV